MTHIDFDDDSTLCGGGGGPKAGGKPAGKASKMRSTRTRGKAATKQGPGASTTRTRAEARAEKVAGLKKQLRQAKAKVAAAKKSGRHELANLHSRGVHKIESQIAKLSGNG